MGAPATTSRGLLLFVDSTRAQEYGTAVPRYDPRDRFFRKAKEEGYRARSAYKLDEIQRRTHVLRRGGRVLDLGAAPGGWCQIAAREVGTGGFVLGIDLEEIPRLPPPIVTWQADAFAPQLADRLRAEGPFDVVLSDLAPKTSGVRGTDEARSIALAERALALALEVLRPSGALVVKVFMGGDFEGFVKACRQAFARVRIVRPEASVARSSKEVYVVGQGLRIPRAAEESERSKRSSADVGAES
jgi:23S rRNA (uridine2552-2'-O)-methyltransferase